jgi:hypothetical protein
MIQLYEQHGFAVNEKLVIQYLQEEKIARNFAIYYDLFNKYKADYQVDNILAGKASQKVKDRASAAKFDERISLLGLLLDAVSGELVEVVELEQALIELKKELQITLTKMKAKGADPVLVMEKQIEALQKKVAAGRKNNTLSAEAIRLGNIVIERMQKQKEILLNHRDALDSKLAYQLLKKDFDGQSAALTVSAKKAGRSLSNVFDFAENVFGEGQEVLILVTELTSNAQTASFISRFGSDAYFRHSKELLFYERQKELILEMENLKLADSN